MIMAAWLMRCLSQGHHTPGLTGEDGKHTSEDLISAGPCLLRREGGKGIPDLPGLVVRVATINLPPFFLISLPRPLTPALSQGDKGQRSRH